MGAKARCAWPSAGADLGPHWYVATSPDSGATLLGAAAICCSASKELVEDVPPMCGAWRSFDEGATGHLHRCSVPRSTHQSTNSCTNSHHIHPNTLTHTPSTHQSTTHAPTHTTYTLTHSHTLLIRKLDLQPYLRLRTGPKDTTVVTHPCKAAGIIKENTVSGETSGADARHRTQAGGLHTRSSHQLS
jgi:hypothetical protein